ncbi:hypothetical protein EMN47_17260 [Prolixibacteraceae bacterium JC049]|nr:hypothetical protein [Prolixibacteraceae bacterium JC049]
MKKVYLLIFTSILFLNSFSQNDEDRKKAHSQLSKAIKLMDNGKIDESIKILKEAKKLDPTNYVYPYEIAYAHYLNKENKKAIKILNKVLKLEEKTDQCYALLGSLWDIEGKPEKAIEIYNIGLEKFPNSGRLYYEKGIVEEVLKKYNDALDSWEKGIMVKPTHASNYHTASIYFSKYTSERIWGVIYGEIFMNLDRGSKKTEQASQLLYKTYKNSIKIKSSTEVSISFSKEIKISPQKFKDKIPFSMPYEMTMALASTSITQENEISIATLVKIRTKFITEWFRTGQNTTYPNILFDWQKELIKLGYFEPYNYWLFMKGNEKEFEKWYNENQKEFDEFIDWFSNNPMKINSENKFFRTQYD